MYQRPKPIKGNLGVFYLPEKIWTKLATENPSYIGQAVQVSNRWRTYLDSAYDGRKHKNCLDRVSLRGHRVLFRLLDWGLSSKKDLDVSERCQIALWRPSLNRVVFGFDKSICQVPLKRDHKPRRLSGIYQLIVVPLSLVNSLDKQVFALTDVQDFIDRDLSANPHRLKGYVPMGKLKFYDF